MIEMDKDKKGGGGEEKSLCMLMYWTNNERIFLHICWGNCYKIGPLDVILHHVLWSQISGEIII